ncbi:MAG: PKD domain-containing protein [Bacteroidia bacterium]|nr:PKD domain-containing protein [Bacteroidia bacterium]
MRKTFCKEIFILFLASISFFGLSAQVSYLATYHPQAGNPGNLNTESDQSDSDWETILEAGISQNQWSSSLSIPFSFKYYGRSVEDLKVSGNGLLSFLSNPTLPQGDNVSLPSASLPDSTIAVFWEKFTSQAPTGSNDVVQTKVFGTAPNRQFWVRWTSYEWGNSNFQFVAAVLSEGSHDIYLVDMYGNQFGDPVSTTVGLQGSSSFAVSYGEANTALNGISPSHLDNSYYKFETYDIEPYDMNVKELLSPKTEGCGRNNEIVSVRFSNVGLLTATGIQAKYSIDGGPFTTAESIPQNLEPGQEYDFTFEQRADISETGSHTLTVVVEVAGDGNSANDSLEALLHSSLSISSFPYQENFEQGDGGWSIGGENPSWELAYPNATVMQGAASGVKAWVTNPDGVYNNLEKSYVSSPCFDLSNAHPDMHIAMKVWWETEYSWDGAVLQATYDGGENWINVGGMNSNPHWFNDNTIGALPGNSPIGWTGTSAGGTGSGGWVPVQHPLGPQLIGKNQVRFRIAFASDNAGFNEGFAFDDVMLDVPPQVDLGADRFFCEGEKLEVSFEDNILWSNGSDENEILLSNTSGSAIIDSMLIVNITGANGLIGRDTIFVSMMPQMQFAFVNQEDIDCANEASGFIGLEIGGGASPLSYEWSNGSQESFVGGLEAGEYEVEITDLNGCKIDSSFTIESLNPELGLEYSTSHAACDGTPIGSINLNAFGGVGGYSYSWNIGGEGSMRENLEAGSYIVTTQDQLGCSREDTILVEQAGDLSVSVAQLQKPACSEDVNGFISLDIEGGSGTYNIFWDHGDTTQNIDQLGPGLYTGYVLDTDGCNKLLPEILLEAETADPEADFDYSISGSTIGFTELSEHATSYLWDFGDGTAKSSEANPAHFYMNNGTYTITLIVSNTCSSDTITKEVSMQTVGLDEEFAENIEVYPNPFENKIQIDFDEPSIEAFEIQVLNLQGKVLEQLAGQRGSHQLEVDFGSDLPAGMYFLRLVGSKGQSLFRIIKQ